MSKFLSEHYDVKMGIVNSTATAGAYTRGYSLQGVKRVSVLCGIDLSSYSSVCATAINPAQFTVMVGTNASVVSAMTSLTSVSLTLGQATIGTLPRVTAVAVAAHGTIATANYLVLDGTTFSVKVNSCVADKNILSSAASSLVKSLASAIATWSTHLETYGLVTAGNATATAVIYIRVKDTAPGHNLSFNCAIQTNAASSDAMCVCPIRASGVIEFTPADVVGTNTSYTHFGIKINSTTTVVQMNSVMILREMDYAPVSTFLSRKEGTK